MEGVGEGGIEGGRCGRGRHQEWKVWAREASRVEGVGEGGIKGGRRGQGRQQGLAVRNLHAPVCWQQSWQQKRAWMARGEPAHRRPTLYKHVGGPRSTSACAGGYFTPTGFGACRERAACCRLAAGPRRHAAASDAAAELCVGACVLPRVGHRRRATQHAAAKAVVAAAAAPPALLVEDDGGRRAAHGLWRRHATSLVTAAAAAAAAAVAVAAVNAATTTAAAVLGSGVWHPHQTGSLRHTVQRTRRSITRRDVPKRRHRREWAGRRRAGGGRDAHTSQTFHTSNAVQTPAAQRSDLLQLGGRRFGRQLHIFDCGTQVCGGAGVAARPHLCAMSTPMGSSPSLALTAQLGMTHKDAW
eukprot:366428-Chlamydomonas_euryale.AAC.4